MARPLRIEYPGAHYHVMNRGNQRQTVFRSAADYALFLGKLADFAELYNVQVLCYCLMPNHFHGYIRTPEGNLSRFMQGFLTSFTVSVNRRRGGSGHVFQGRFKAQLVEREHYGNELSRYIHLNPVRTKSASELSIDSKRRLLRQYRWSSYASCIGLRKKPKWLHYGPILESWGPRRSDQMAAYRRFVEEGLLRNINDPSATLEAWSILGSDSFIDRIKRTYLLKREADAREEPELVHLQSSLSVGDVVSVTARVCGVSDESILRRRQGCRLPRRIGMYCVCRYCRHQRSLTELAREFGVSVSGLTRGRDRVAAALAADETVATLVNTISAELQKSMA